MTTPAPRCARCDADLTVPPHVKLCWHGVPGAHWNGEKGDLCDPCHEQWKVGRALCETCGHPAAIMYVWSTGSPTYYCDQHKDVGDFTNLVRITKT